jgi:hypothetical protein
MLLWELSQLDSICAAVATVSIRQLEWTRERRKVPHLDHGLHYFRWSMLLPGMILSAREKFATIFP